MGKPRPQPKRYRRWWLDNGVVKTEYDPDRRDGRALAGLAPPHPWPLALALHPVDGPVWSMGGNAMYLHTSLDVVELGHRAVLFLQRQNGEIEDITWQGRRRALVEDGILAP